MGMINRAAAFFVQIRRCGIFVRRYNRSGMRAEETTIEAEVVEIDGITVEPRPTPAAPESDRPRWREWRTWQGRVRKLDSRWWPLWFVLGFILLVLVVAIGMVAAVVIVTFWIFKVLLNGIASLLFPSHELQRR